jgi:hypothetical protein
MIFARRRLSWVIALWLVSQVAGIAAAPVGFCCRGVQTAIDDDHCCPGLLPGQVCPMHHTKQDGKRTCKMRGGCASTFDAALIALAGGIGVLPVPTSLVSAFAPGIFLADVSSSAMSRAFIPESPPPRA